MLGSGLSEAHLPGCTVLGCTDARGQARGAPWRCAVHARPFVGLVRDSGGSVCTDFLPPFLEAFWRGCRGVRDPPLTLPGVVPGPTGATGRCGRAFFLLGEEV